MNTNIQEYVFAGVSSAAALWAVYKVFGPKIAIKNITKKLVRDGQYRTRSLNQITDITIHHTAGPADQTTTGIANYHVNSKGWPGIGYHYVIDSDGTIEQTNALKSVSYHNGYNNTNAIGIALKGNFELYPPPIAQIRALHKLIKHIKRKAPAVQNLVRHKEYPGASTACPGKLFPFAAVLRRSGLDAPYSRPTSYGASPIAIGASLTPQPGYDPQRADN